MTEDINIIFQKYLEEHADDQSIDFSPLLNKHPSLKDSLNKKIEAYKKVIGVFSQEEPVEQKTTHIGKTIGGCKILKILGQGGMGVVYLAHQEKLNRKVVIKILRPFAVDNKDLKERFKRESRIIARLNHKHIVPVYDVGEDDGSLYIIMKYVEGLSLGQLIEKLSDYDRAKLTIGDINKAISDIFQKEHSLNYKTPTEFFCNIIIQVGEALQYAHDNGVIHRDVKPSNIIIEKDGNPVLLDFGLSHDEVETNLTMSGDFLGTPIYSAPECFSNEPIINLNQLDVYSLGVTLYELVTGNFPFDGKSVYEIYSNIKNKAPKTPSKHIKISRDLELIVLNSISQISSHRYDNVSLFIEDLDNYLHFRPVKASRISVFNKIRYGVKRNLRTLYFLIPALLIVTVFSGVSIQQYYNNKQSGYYLIKGLEQHQFGNNNKAKEFFEKSLEFDTNNTQAFSELVNIRDLLGEDNSLLLKDIEKQLNQHPYDEYLISIYVLILQNNGKDDKAEEVCIDYLKTDSRHFNCLLALYSKYWKEAKTVDKAIEITNRIYAFYPDKPDVLANAAIQSYKFKRKSEAFKFLNKAVELNEKKYVLNLADLYVIDEDYEKAISAYKTVLKHYPEDAKTAYSIALWSQKLNKYPDSIKYIKLALKQKPNEIEYQIFLDKLTRMNNLSFLKYKKRGYKLFINKQYKEAIPYLEAAITFNDNNGDFETYEGLGISYARQGYFEKALEYFIKANEQKPNKITQKAIDSIKLHLEAYDDLNTYKAGIVNESK